MTSDDKKTQDRSIEDILKSIRNIIKNNDPVNVGNSEEDILELIDVAPTKSYVNTANNNKQRRTMHNRTVLPKYSRMHEPVQDNDCKKSLISERSAAEISNILKQFSKQATISVKEHKKRHLAIEEFILEMIRPELTSWLDKNLPVLVRSVIEQEIRRLIPDENEDE